MGEWPFIGSEAIAGGRLTPYALRSRFASMHPDVYIAKGAEVTAVIRAKAAWLWSRRKAVIAGQSAAALHGAKWVDRRGPAQLIYDNRRPPRGIRTWADRFDDDEVQLLNGMMVTTPARTALDIACRYDVESAVAKIDALARATKLKVADVELLIDRYRGRHGIKNARVALDLVDAGAESPRETWLRLLLIRAGFPRPQTQVPVYNEYGVLVAILDLGWEDIRVGADYEGKHHWNSRSQIDHDIRRFEDIGESGWIDIRVTARDTEAGVIRRIAAARARGERGTTG
ncbi:hypothetical protein [Mycobacterium sp. 29Ha]|uniref:hypothetical protein n=1 Tax=Mycobacterium sp. 29Ha TaxID=2939268 RepID=UPI0029394A22|nr:hypothetical protein [Mycobacterium sp. 29Ha]MDV3132999.1 hypothetical protein [Mycobacterium sp. 29Ha]